MFSFAEDRFPPALRWLWAGWCACPGVPLSESGFSGLKDFQD